MTSGFRPAGIELAQAAPARNWRQGAALTASETQRIATAVLGTLRRSPDWMPGAREGLGGRLDAIVSGLETTPPTNGRLSYHAGQHGTFSFTTTDGRNVNYNIGTGRLTIAGQIEGDIRRGSETAFAVVRDILPIIPDLNSAPTAPERGQPGGSLRSQATATIENA